MRVSVCLLLLLAHSAGALDSTSRSLRFPADTQCAIICYFECSAERSSAEECDCAEVLIVEGNNSTLCGIPTDHASEIEVSLPVQQPELASYYESTDAHSIVVSAIPYPSAFAYVLELALLHEDTWFLAAASHLPTFRVRVPDICAQYQMRLIALDAQTGEITLLANAQSVSDRPDFLMDENSLRHEMQYDAATDLVYVEYRWDRPYGYSNADIAGYSVYSHLVKCGRQGDPYKVAHQAEPFATNRGGLARVPYTKSHITDRCQLLFLATNVCGDETVNEASTTVSFACDKNNRIRNYNCNQDQRPVCNVAPQFRAADIANGTIGLDWTQPATAGAPSKYVLYLRPITFVDQFPFYVEPAAEQVEVVEIDGRQASVQLPVQSQYFEQVHGVTICAIYSDKPHLSHVNFAIISNVQLQFKCFCDGGGQLGQTDPITEALLAPDESAAAGGNRTELTVTSNFISLENDGGNRRVKRQAAAFDPDGCTCLHSAVAGEMLDAPTEALDVPTEAQEMASNASGPVIAVSARMPLPIATTTASRTLASFPSHPVPTPGLTDETDDDQQQPAVSSVGVPEFLDIGSTHASRTASGGLLIDCECLQPDKYPYLAVQYLHSTQSLPTRNKTIRLLQPATLTITAHMLNVARLDDYSFQLALISSNLHKFSWRQHGPAVSMWSFDALQHDAEAAMRQDALDPRVKLLLIIALPLCLLLVLVALVLLVGHYKLTGWLRQRQEHSYYPAAHQAAVFGVATPEQKQRRQSPPLGSIHPSALPPHTQRTVHKLDL